MRQRAAKIDPVSKLERRLADEALVARLLSRDPHAWAYLQHRYGAALRGAVVALVSRYGTEDESSDTVQDILADFSLSLLDHDMIKLRVFDANKIASLRAWLVLLVEHHTFNVLRALRVRRTQVADDAGEDAGRAGVGARWCGASVEDEDFCDHVRRGGVALDSVL